MTDDLGNTLYKRGYFPNAGRNPGSGNQQFPMALGVAEGQARIAQLQRQGRQGSGYGGSMLNSPVEGGGSMWVPASQTQGYLARGYTQSVPTMSKFSTAFPAIGQGSGLSAATQYGSSGQLGAQPMAQPAATQQGYNLYANNPSTETQQRRWFDPGHNYGF